jgi:hypothetical protein
MITAAEIQIIHLAIRRWICPPHDLVPAQHCKHFVKFLINLHWGFALMDSCVATITFSVSPMHQRRLSALFYLSPSSFTLLQFPSPGPTPKLDVCITKWVLSPPETQLP